MSETSTTYGGDCGCGRRTLVLEVHSAATPFECACGRRWRWASVGVSEEIPHALVPALCLDLDGTVRGSRSGTYFGPASPTDVELLPNVSDRVWAARDAGFYIVGVSNQGVVGYGSKTEVEVEAIEMATRRAFPQGDPFHDILMAYALPASSGGKVPPHHVRSLLRKPGYGMLVLAEERARTRGILLDWDRSLMVGDRPEDEGCARAAGVTFAWAKDYFGWNEMAQGDRS
jgi:D-glycero-D-manno-heptose 1,7-bisphosphate phosphatase